MKCPFCEEEGKKSRLTIGMGGSTLLGFSNHYDEDGLWHNHDPNTHSTNFACSNGHRFVKMEKRRCVSCDFGVEEPRIELLP